MIGERVCITGATVRPIDSAVRTVSTTAWSGSWTAFSSDGTSEGTALRERDHPVDVVGHDLADLTEQAADLGRADHRVLLRVGTHGLWVGTSAMSNRCTAKPAPRRCRR